MLVITSPDFAPLQSYTGKFRVAANPFTASRVSKLKLLWPKKRVNQIAHNEK